MKSSLKWIFFVVFLVNVLFVLMVYVLVLCDVCMGDVGEL